MNCGVRERRLYDSGHSGLMGWCLENSEDLFLWKVLSFLEERWEQLLDQESRCVFARLGSPWAYN